MRRLFAALVLSVFFANCCLAVQDTPHAPATQSVTHSGASQFVLHLDIENSRETQTGQLLVELTRKIPFIAEQIETLPEELCFLKQANLQSVSIYLPASRTSGDEVVVDVKGDYDRTRFLKLIEKQCPLKNLRGQY